MKIHPSLQGKSYKIWQISMNYLHFPLEEMIDNKNEGEPGFRLTTINCCWSAIESFFRECLNELILVNYHKLNLPDEYKFKQSFFKEVELLYKTEEKKELYKFDKELELKGKLSDFVSTQAWGKIINISGTLGFPLKENVKNETWAFINNLYKLRNGFMHGQNFKILLSNIEEIPDFITKHYIKALKYLNGKGIISLDKLISKQNISDLLNKKTTDFVIMSTINAFDEIAEIFKVTSEANQWKKMREK